MRSPRSPRSAGLRWDSTPGTPGTPEPAQRPADVALVAVHGMGRQRPAATLLEWAEPILGRLDWLATRAGNAPAEAVETHRLGVTIERASLTSSPQSSVVVAVRWLAPKAQMSAAVTVHERRIAVLEARWSESFVPMTRTEVFQWGARFLGRSLTRMFLQVARTLVGVPWVTLYPSTAGRVTPAGVAHRVLAVPMVFAGLLVAGGLAALMTTLGVLVSLILPLLSPLLLIPLVKNAVQAGVDVLVDFVGDVGTYRTRPLRAAAMGDVLVDTLDRARAMLSPTGEIHVLAHSQGAAIAAKVLFHDLDLTDFPVTRLATIGAAITLLGTTAWNPTPAEDARYRPVANWATHAPRVDWSNYWAIWDPFAAGPIGDSYGDRRRRWRACYARDRRGAMLASPYFPSEQAVHNTSNPLTDHQSYPRNILQVIDPIARELLGPGFDSGEGDVTERMPRVVRLRRARGVTLLAAIVTAVLLPSLTWFRSAVDGLVGAVLAGLNGATALVGVAPVMAPDLLGGTFGTAVLIALLAAALIWLNSRFFDWSEGRLVWKSRTPLERALGATVLERLVSVLSVLVQLAFVGGAAGAVFLVTTQAAASSAPPATPLVGPGGAPGLAATLSVLVVLVLLAVRWGKLPQRAPANRPPLHPAATTATTTAPAPAQRASDVSE